MGETNNQSYFPTLSVPLSCPNSRSLKEDNSTSDVPTLMDNRGGAFAAYKHYYEGSNKRLVMTFVMKAYGL